MLVQVQSGESSTLPSIPVSEKAEDPDSEGFVAKGLASILLRSAEAGSGTNTGVSDVGA